MKWMAWLLLLANVLVAAYFLGGDFWPRREADRIVPLNVERLSLRSQSGTPQPPSPSRTETALCVEWRGLASGERVKAREQLKALVEQRAMSFAETPVDTLRRVMFPPLPSAQLA
ncbi:MAG: hypothetical protein AB1716_26775, partial [Planctomycetota bacterium]